MKKSHLVGFILTFLFGPLGLFYSNVIASIGLILIGLTIGGLSAGFGFLVMWPVSMIFSFFLVGRYNKKVLLEERRHREILEVQAGATPEDAQKKAKEKIK